MTTKLKPATLDYARLLQKAGFTVYVPVSETSGAQGWFHYSRELDGLICYGTVTVESSYGYGSLTSSAPEHHMPIHPSRENGSSLIVRGPLPHPLTVGAAEKTASPTNLGAFVFGSQKNAKPWGIGARYVELATDE